MKFNPAHLQGEEVEKMSTMLSNQGVLIEQGPNTKMIADCFALCEAIGIDTYRLRKFIIGKYPNVRMEVLGPAPYERAVKKIGNKMDLALVDLKEVLSLADIGRVSWKGIGKPLAEEILQKTFGACDRLLALPSDYEKVHAFVGRIMEYFEPNLFAVFGSEVASKLIVGTAGGLSALANISADDFSLIEPCCDGKLVFDAGRVAALLVLAISAPLSNEKHMFSIPPRIFHHAVEVLGRISHALSDVMDQDTLLAYLYHCSISRVISSDNLFELLVINSKNLTDTHLCMKMYLSFCVMSWKEELAKFSTSSSAGALAFL
ncbi:hypothetical protein RHMOL_Rhmol05G0313200 [Rhododendron molle]|uniref:Uncharacterized protein n=2 Tax=Rhododendron molle TaxID=49168 RepID=A0ACC0NVB6_RHOML|nr:hypothetical protein RHMOL_Rhmol05G0313200 [Rhododendron molle]KAI8557155.1 hypothetical protein RHMOL_Rhmol05G0313200 [Rhododendron molle]